MLFLVPAGTDEIKDHFLNGNKACLCGCLALPITVWRVVLKPADLAGPRASS